MGGYCKAHGGGKKCTAPNCTRAARGGTSLCVDHLPQIPNHF